MQIIMENLREELKQAITKNITSYIGYAYSDDLHFGDYLTINKLSWTVSHQRGFMGGKRPDIDYYELIHLVRSSGPSTYEPDPIKVEYILLQYFPNQIITKYTDKLCNVVNDFIASHGYVNNVMCIPEASILICTDDFVPHIYCEADSTELEEYDDEDYVPDGYELIDKPVRRYVQRTNNRMSMVADVEKLTCLAIEVSLQHEGFNKIMDKEND